MNNPTGDNMVKNSVATAIKLAASKPKAVIKYYEEKEKKKDRFQVTMALAKSITLMFVDETSFSGYDRNSKAYHDLIKIKEEQGKAWRELNAGDNNNLSGLLQGISSRTTDIQNKLDSLITELLNLNPYSPNPGTVKDNLIKIVEGIVSDVDFIIDSAKKALKVAGNNSHLRQIEVHAANIRIMMVGD